MAEASPGVMRRCPAKVEPIDPYVFLWAGLVQGCLRNHSGASGTWKLNENRRFYGFTDFRGKPARRGRGRRASANQVTAGMRQCFAITRRAYRDKVKSAKKEAATVVGKS